MFTQKEIHFQNRNTCVDLFWLLSTKRNFVCFIINRESINTIKLLSIWKAVKIYFLLRQQQSRDRLHTEKSFRNLIKSTGNQIVFTVFRLTWIQTDVRLVLNQPKNGKYNLISGWFNKIPKKFLCVCTTEEKNLMSVLYFENILSRLVFSQYSNKYTPRKPGWKPGSSRFGLSV